MYLNLSGTPNPVIYLILFEERSIAVNASPAGTSIAISTILELDRLNTLSN